MTWFKEKSKNLGFSFACYLSLELIMETSIVLCLKLAEIENISR